MNRRLDLSHPDVRLVTWTGAVPDGDYDSRPLLAALRERGLVADIRAWNDPSIDWADATVTVIRSAWDYHENLAGFLDWVDRTAAVTSLHNRPGIVRWNTDKRYLLDLERAGIDIVPTIAASPADASDLDRAITARGWSEVVLKPAVSLDGHGVHRAKAGEDSLAAACHSLAGENVLIVQPFMPRIIRDGELSLTFIDGRFSHAVRKRPSAGEFRVQERLGGTVEPAAAPPGSIVFAQAVLATLDGRSPLYARVDIIETGAGFLLTELELVEPSLFLAQDPGAADTFAAAIEAEVGRCRARARDPSVD